MLLDEVVMEQLVDYFREIEEARIDEEELDGYVCWFMNEYSEFEDFDEALDEFCNEMWAAVTPELFD